MHAHGLLVFLMLLTVSCTTERGLLTPSQAEVRPAEVGDRDLVLYASLLDHPHEFDPGAIEASMRSLHVSLRSPNFPEVKRKIFSEKAAQEAAPLIVKAFLEVKPFQIVKFRIHTERGVTAGETFVKDGALNWRFELIEGLPQFEEFYNPYQYGTETGPPSNWALIPAEGQRFYDDTLLGIPLGGKNWIVVELEPGKGKAGIEERGPKAKQPEAEDRTLMGRLKLLRELKQSGAISDEQYRAKVKVVGDAAERIGPDPKDHLLFLKELRAEGLISEGEYKDKSQKALNRL